MSKRLGLEGTSVRRLALQIFLFFLLLYLLTANGRVVNRDGEAVFQVARSIAEAGRLDVPAESVFEESTGPNGTDGDSLSFATETARRGTDGRLYSMYGLGQSLASVPLYYAGKLASMALPQVSPYFVARLAASALNAVVSALACAILLLYAHVLGFSLRNALVVTLIYGTATMAWPYSKSYASEPITGLVLLTSAFCLARSGSSARSPIWLAAAGAALGFAVMVRVSTGILIPVFAAYMLAVVWEKRVGSRTTSLRQQGRTGTVLFSLAAFAIPLAVVLAAIGWYNHVRFGSPLITGYQSIAWDTPFFSGLYGLLLSPGKGLFWYNPILIVSALAFVAFFRWRRREALFLASLVLVWLAFHSPYKFWEGGWSWGPRLLLPVLPFLLLPLGALSLRSSPFVRLGSRLLPVAVALGLAIQISAVGVDYTRYLWANYSANPQSAYSQVVHQPASSPLLGQWLELVTVVSNVVRPGELEKARGDIAAKEEKRALAGLSEAAHSVAVLDDTQVAGLNFPDFWFVYLYLFGAPLAVVTLPAIVLLAGAGAMLAVLDRRLRALAPELSLEGEAG